MGGLSLLARQVGRPTHGMASLSTAAVVMTVANPLVLWDVGFQLSFAASLGLILYAEPLTAWFIRIALRWLPEDKAERLAGPVGEFVLFTLAAQVTPLPLMMYYFSRFSLVLFVANPVILPVQPPVMILGSMATLAGNLWLPLGRPLAWIAWAFRSLSRWARAYLKMGGVSFIDGKNGAAA